jgi:hypothetical protein
MAAQPRISLGGSHIGCSNARRLRGRLRNHRPVDGLGYPLHALDEIVGPAVALDVERLVKGVNA